MQCTLPYNVWTSQPKLRFNVQFKIEFHLLTFASYHLKQKSKLKLFAILIISIVIMTKERQKCKLKTDTKWHMTYDLWEHSTWHRMTELLNVLLFISVESCDQKHLHLFINFDDSQNFISIISNTNVFNTKETVWVMIKLGIYIISIFIFMTVKYDYFCGPFICFIN